MCRFVAYSGPPILLSELLYKPINSLINQSFQAREREEPLNGDGFGVGWYAPEIDPSPGVFTSIQPAWNNRNLRYLSQKIKTPCFFAHVRASTRGDVSEANCHPFQFAELLFMHNGDVAGFALLKRKLRTLLSDPIYAWIRGHTDSEHLFALFLEHYLKRGEPASLQVMRDCLKATIDQICELQQAAGIDECSYLNLAITNGKEMVASRFVSDTDWEPATLYSSSGRRFECRDGVCMMHRSDAPDRVGMIVSEKLTDLTEDWVEVPKNNLVLISSDRQTSFEVL